MNAPRIINALHTRARRSPDAVAIDDGSRTVGYAELAGRVEELADALRREKSEGVALLADNGIDWIVADLAGLASGTTVVPVPSFYTATQFDYLLTAAPVDLVLGGPGTLADGIPGFDVAAVPAGRLRAWRRSGAGTAAAAVHDGTAKITFTSGSTGFPKGVCLSADGMERTAAGLAELLVAARIERHLCVMPLAVLLENVAGVYASLLLGNTIVAPPLASVGLSGSSRLDVNRLGAALGEYGAQSVILLPQMLRDLLRHADGRPLPGCGLRYVAVGGARVSTADLADADRIGLPVYQGYGLSECNSVVALNRPGDNRPGSVGRPLPGVSIRIAADGEIHVRSAPMRGYLDGEPGAVEFATGDIGHVDREGFLYVTGRKKDIFITSFGRNVSPEWPEAELLHQPEIAQAVVHGEGRSANVAVLVPSGPDVPSSRLADAVARANRGLPDYARIGDWFTASEPFSLANGLLTSTGKPRRDAVLFRYFLDPAFTVLPRQGSAHELL